jgi:pimeloyl-ACP methyl ester carboxylesterase
MAAETLGPPVEHPVHIRAGTVDLAGTLALPQNAGGIIVFAHGSGSGRHSPRNQFVAQVLREACLGTLLIDLLTAEEERIDLHTAELRFDIGLLAERVVGATDWLTRLATTNGLSVAYFGASTGAAAALVAAARRPEKVRAVVSRGGRPDLADHYLPQVKAPTLLIVGGRDEPVIGLNRQALNRLGAAEKGMHVIPNATHLFEEPGALDEVARLATDWFARHVAGHSPVV